VRRALAQILLAAVFVAVVGWQTLFERFQVNDPYSGRREVVMSSIAMLQARPWTGFGLGTWTSVYPSYAQKDFGVFINAAHNDWLQWADDGGIPMLACLFLLFSVSVWLAWKMPWGLGVPAVFLHCLIDFPMQGRFLPATLFLVFGILLRRSLMGHGSPSAQYFSVTRPLRVLELKSSLYSKLRFHKLAISHVTDKKTLPMALILARAIDLPTFRLYANSCNS
jgi:O-antigen ligase